MITGLMKYALPTLLFTFIVMQASAQKGLPAMGKVDKADLEMKDCDFDKGAVAVKLIDYGNVYYRRGKVGATLFNTVYERRVRIKILKEAGLSYADVSIPYFDQDNEEQIQKITAYTYNIDGSGNIKTTEVGKTSIYSKRINKMASRLIIAFPEAKVGSIIEYKYTMERQKWYRMRDWYFQGRIPTRYSEYQLNIPSIYRFMVQPSVIDKLDIKEDVTEDNIALNDGVYTVKVLRKNYSMQNLKAIHDEPYMGAPGDYMQRLEFLLSQIDYGDGDVVDLTRKWSDVVAALLKDEDFGLQLEKKVPETDAIMNEVARLADKETKMRLIWNYVRRNMNWNEDESIYADEGVVKAWNKKTGNTADINLMLLNLLKQAGIDAYPILFSTRDNGLVNSFHCFVTQFNTLMVYVPLGEKYFILDATDKNTGYRMIPEDVVNTKGLVIKGTDGEWLDAIDDKHKYKVMAAANGVIDSNGVMKGSCLVNCDEYAKSERVALWAKDREKFKAAYFSKPDISIKIDELTVNNAGIDSLPLEQKLQFTYTLNSSGDYRYFTVNLFSDLETNPFIADERVSDIDYGYLQDYMIFGSYTIPDGYAFEPLPENIAMTTPDNGIQFNRYLQAEDNMLNVRMTVSFKRFFYTAQDYADFAAFYKKMLAKLNEQIVIKKKTAP